MGKIVELPEGIIITISEKMLKEKGAKNWLGNFYSAMNRHDACTYWMRVGNPPKKDFLYVYLCLYGKVRFRTTYVLSQGAGEMAFEGGKKMFAKAWVVLAGPLVRPKRGQEPLMKGFRGFRYTEKLF